MPQAQRLVAEQLPGHAVLAHPAHEVAVNADVHRAELRVGHAQVQRRPIPPPLAFELRQAGRDALPPGKRIMILAPLLRDRKGEHQQIFKGPIHYDGLLRVPLIVRGPGVPAGVVVDEPVGTIDLDRKSVV